jgi:sugar lactone lactonase YvrE
MVRLERVGELRAALGEGPLWDVRAQRLWWVDPMEGRLYRTAPTGETQRWKISPEPTAVCLTERGDLLLAVRSGFARFNPSTGSLRALASVGTAARAERMNDGGCDPAGRFWAGSMAEDLTPGGGALYRLDCDLRLERVLDGIGLSNGIGWSPDGRTLYYTDSFTYRIDQLDFDAHSGALSNRRPFAVLERSEGLPDGLSVDAEGGVWTALFGGSAVRRYAPDGRLDRVVDVPVPAVTSVCFGGAELDELYITTSSLRFDNPELPRVGPQPPEAGALFRCRPGARGRPPHRFAG